MTPAIFDTNVQAGVVLEIYVVHNLIVVIIVKKIKIVAQIVVVRENVRTD